MIVERLIGMLIKNLIVLGMVAWVIHRAVAGTGPALPAVDHLNQLNFLQQIRP